MPVCYLPFTLHLTSNSESLVARIRVLNTRDLRTPLHPLRDPALHPPPGRRTAQHRVKPAATEWLNIARNCLTYRHLHPRLNARLISAESEHPGSPVSHVVFPFRRGDD